MSWASVPSVAPKIFTWTVAAIIGGAVAAAGTGLLTYADNAGPNVPAGAPVAAAFTEMLGSRSRMVGIGGQLGSGAPIMSVDEYPVALRLRFLEIADVQLVGGRDPATAIGSDFTHGAGAVFVNAGEKFQVVLELVSPAINPTGVALKLQGDQGLSMEVATVGPLASGVTKQALGGDQWLVTFPVGGAPPSSRHTIQITVSVPKTWDRTDASLCFSVSELDPSDFAGHTAEQGRV